MEFIVHFWIIQASLVGSIKWVLLIVLLGFSAMVSGAEVAFFSLSPSIFKDEDKSSQLKGVESLLKRPKRLLATILVANNFINIAIVLLFASLRQSLFGSISNPLMILVLEIGLVTFLILLFGEILPKIYANRNAVSFARLMEKPLRFLDRYLLFWMSIPMSQTTSFLERKLSHNQQNISVDQLSQALELTAEDETSVEEQKILQGIVSFGNTDTKQVMRPRMDVFALEHTLSMAEIIPLILEKGYSRIPVYKEQLDDILGILYIKDLIPHLKANEFPWQQLIRKAIYVPENKKLDDLLKEFQQKKVHLAIVVDEYGGTSGLITLEDIIEEIVGDISDEFDEESLQYSKLDPKTYVFDAKTGLKDFFRVISIEDESLFDTARSDAESLAGLILELAQKFPRKSQKIKFEGFVFTVEGIENRRITQVKVKLPA
ncbi:MAG: gliding motility-associated protein GldE [Flavobacteriaceae bacterium]